MKIFTDVARLGHFFYSWAGWVCFGTERVCYEVTARLHHRVINQSQALFVCLFVEMRVHRFFVRFHRNQMNNSGTALD